MAEFRPLIELIDEVVSEDKMLQYCNIIDVVTDDKSCVEFMNFQLHDDLFETVDKSSAIYELAQNRARHSVITYLLGRVFMPFGRILEDQKETLLLWAKISMYHDYGYHSTYVTQKTINLRDLVKNYLLVNIYTNELSILNDWSILHPEDLAYTYAVIENYFEYSKKLHDKLQDKEKVDHGILGGVLIFDRLVGKWNNSVQHDTKELLNIKKISLAIAQHNIFRIGKCYRPLADGFNLESIYKENPFRIDKTKPWLLFLSLIDTVECVKKFSKGENPNKSFNAKTVLRKLKLSVSVDKIEIDFSDLRKHAKKEKKEHWFNCVFQNYKNSIEDFSSWTAFCGKENNELITITLPRK